MKATVCRQLAVGALACVALCLSCKDDKPSLVQPAADQQAPTTPGQLTCAAVSPSQIDLSWSAASDNVGVEAYTVYRNGLAIATVLGTSASDTGLACDITYCYEVTALDAHGNESAKSSQKCCKTKSCNDVTPPSTPANLSCTAGQTEVSLTWTSSTDNIAVTGYRIYRGGVKIKDVAGTSTTDTGLTCHTEYCYHVTAYDEAGNESPASSEECCQTSDCKDDIPPTIPTGVACQATGQNGTSITWNPSSDNVGVTGYKIYRNSVFLKEVTGLSTTDSGLSCGTQYCYTVAAVDQAGNESGQSTASCCQTSSCPDTDPPTTPTGLACSATSPTSNAVSWNASSDNIGVTGYRLYRDGSFVKQVSGTSTTDTGLNCGAGYCYRVSAVDAAANESNRSSQDCCITDDCPIEITNAAVAFRIIQDNNYGFGVHECQGTWSEGSVTWNSHPAWKSSAHANGYRVTAGDGSSWIKFNISASLVMKWYNGTTANNGFVIWDGYFNVPAPTNTMIRLYARESSSSTEPYADIYWTDLTGSHRSRLPITYDADILNTAPDSNSGSSSDFYSGWLGGSYQQQWAAFFKFNVNRDLLEQYQVN